MNTCERETNFVEEIEKRCFSLCVMKKRNKECSKDIRVSTFKKDKLCGIYR